MTYIVFGGMLNAAQSNPMRIGLRTHVAQGTIQLHACGHHLANTINDPCLAMVQTFTTISIVTYFTMLLCWHKGSGIFSVRK